MVQIQDRLDGNLHTGHLTSLGILQQRLEGVALTTLIAIDREFGIDFQAEIAVVGIGNGAHRIVRKSHILGMIDHDITMDATKTPEVLILEIRAIAVTINLDGNLILATPHILRDVELRGLHTALRVAHHLAIDPDIEGTHHTLEAQERLPQTPLGGQREATAVLPHGVALDVGRVFLFRRTHHTGRVNLEDITCRGVDGGSVAIHLPVGRHLEVIPLAVVEVGMVKLLHTLLGTSRPAEFPLAVERNGAVALRLAIADKGSTSRLTVDLQHVVILPIGRLGHGCEGQGRKAQQR